MSHDIVRIGAILLIAYGTFTFGWAVASEVAAWRRRSK